MLRDSPERVTSARRGNPSWLAFVLGSCALVAIAVYSVRGSQTAQPFSATVRSGELDLSAWDARRDGPVSLRGTWTLYWERLLAPSEIVAEHGVPIAVPGQWLNLGATPNERPGHGAATYVIRMRLAPNTAELSMRMPEPNAGQRVFVDGVLIDERGRPALSRADERLAQGSYVVPIRPRGNEVEIVVQMSNHATRTGGFAEAPLLGGQQAVLADYSHDVVWPILLFGICMTAALYHFGIYTFTRGASSVHATFSLYCVAVGVHTLTADASPLNELLGFEAPWWVAIKMEYVALYGSMALGLWVLRQLFRDEFRSTLVRVLLWVGAGFTALAALGPAELYTRGLLAFSMCALATLLVSVVLTGLAARRGRPTALFIFVAALFYLVTSGHDVLAINGLLDSEGRWLSEGVLAFVGAQGWSLAKSYADQNIAVERLSRDLLASNATLARINVSIRRFLPEEMFRLLGRKSIDEVERGDQTQEVMEVMFCDIREFTPLVESMAPGKAFQFINEYLGHMEPAIHRHGGFINQYLGDCIMALFPTGADAALRAALDMLTALDALNAGRREKALRVGIGIHTGPITLGVIGGQSRLAGGVVGDAVNLAARIEALTKTYGTSLLVSEATKARLRDPMEFELQEVDRVMPKGKSEAVRIYAVHRPPKLGENGEPTFSSARCHPRPALQQPGTA